MIKFTPGQTEAIETLDRNLLVKAGAGAGKTRVLVERYVNILQKRKADVEGIVAITFTRKAAREMKERVYARVLSLMPAFPDGSERQRWREVEQKMEHAPISTIHSLCSRILREYPAEAKVDPEFVLMEEVDHKKLMAEIWQETLDKAAVADEPWLKKLLANYTPDQLCQEFLPLFERVHDLGLIGPDLPLLLWPEPVEQLEHARDKCKRSIIDLFDWIPGSGKMNATQARLAEMQKKRLIIEAQIAQAETNPAVLEELETRFKGLRGGGELADALRRRKEAGQDFHGIILDLRVQQIVPALCEWFFSVEQNWIKAKSQLSALTYNDLEIGAEKLLRSNPRVCERFRQRVRYLMVDECQDINERQRQIIYLLAGGTAEELRGDNLFVVGDAKQSIYRFRGADNRVFSRVEADIVRSGGKVIELLENFRSQRSLVGAFNDFFQILMPMTVCGEETNGDDAVEFKKLVGTCGDEQQAQLELWVLDADALVGDDAKAKEADMIAARVRSMVADPAQNLRLCDIVLLLRAFTHVNLYEAAFARAGIPYYVAGGRGFINRQEVADVLELIRFLANPYNEGALFATLRSPWFLLSDQALLQLRRAGGEGGIRAGLSVAAAIEGLGEQEAATAIQANNLLDRWVSRSRFLMPEQILREAFTATRFDWLQLSQCLGDRRYANLQKLLNMARSFADSGGRSLEGFLDYVELRAKDEGEAEIDSETGNTVRIMTIHKSKGLEFPVVIVPDLQRKFNIRNRLALFLPGLGLGLKVADERGKLIETARFRRLARQDNAMEKAELKRLLYVAMTRAERQIIMSAVVDSPKTEKRFANSTGWLDWTRNLTGLTGPVQEWPEQVMMGETCVRILKENGQFRMTDDFTAKLAELDRIRIGEEISREAAIIPVENKTTPDNLPDDISINISPICAIPTKAKILSPAYLADFTACPRRYFYAHICRMPETESPNRAAPVEHSIDMSLDMIENQLAVQLQMKGIPAKDLGVAFHRFLELMTVPEDWRESMEQALQEKFAPALWDKAIETLGPWARKYAASSLCREIGTVAAERRELSFQYQVLSAEQQFPAVRLSGQVDRVLFYSDGTLGIVDYKTDWFEPGSLQKKAARYQLQITGYALAMGAIFGRSPRDARLYFARTGETMAVDVTSRSLNQAKCQLQDMARFVRSHDQESDYSCRIVQCPECRYQGVCLHE